MPLRPAGPMQVLEVDLANQAGLVIHAVAFSTRPGRLGFVAPELPERCSERQKILEAAWQAGTAPTECALALSLSYRS